MSVIEDVFTALPASPGGVSPAQVHAKMGSWSLISVRHALRELCDQGRAIFEGEDGVRRYSRHGEAESAR